MRANRKLPRAFFHVSPIIRVKALHSPFCGYRWSTDLLQVACSRGLTQLEAAMQVGEEKEFGSQVLPALCDRQAWREETQRTQWTLAPWPAGVLAFNLVWTMQLAFIIPSSSIPITHFETHWCFPGLNATYQVHYWVYFKILGALFFLLSAIILFSSWYKQWFCSSI